MEITDTTYRRDTGRKEGLVASITSILTLADLHSDQGPMASSAALCAREAHALAADGREDVARSRALRSLAYSVGMFHADYQFAAA